MAPNEFSIFFRSITDGYIGGLNVKDDECHIVSMSYSSHTIRHTDSNSGQHVQMNKFYPRPWEKISTNFVRITSTWTGTS